MANTNMSYPYDATGRSETNLVRDEVHTLDPINKGYLKPNYGEFYKDSLVVRDSAGNVLAEGTHYRIPKINVDETLKLGKAISDTLIFIDKTVSKVWLTYQALGGDANRYVGAINQSVDELDLNARPVHWSSVIDRPQAYVPDINHLHDSRALYGMEFVSKAIDELGRAINTGDETAFNELRQLVSNVDEWVQDHEDRKDNPHQVTKAQVGLGKVENYKPSTASQALIGTDNTSYMTPFTVKISIDEFIKKDLDAHKARFDDPHNVTKTQVGLGEVANFRPATLNEVLSGTASTLYTTPYTVAGAIKNTLGSGLEDHIKDYDDPHNVTKFQINLGNVLNYPPTTYKEVQDALKNFESIFSTWTRISHLNNKQGINSQYIAWDTLSPPNPFIAVTQDGNGNVVYDGGFPKLYNSYAPSSGTLSFSQLSGTMKYVYNTFNWISNKALEEKGVRKMLVLGDKTTSQDTYRVKSTGPADFRTTLSRMASITGFTATFKDRDDYGGSLNPTLAELEQYNFVVIISSYYSAPKSAITPDAINAIVQYRESGGGLFLVTDHGPELGTVTEATNNFSGFFSMINQIALRFGVYFKGTFNRSYVNVGFLRSTYGNHQLYNNLSDSDTIYGGGSESEIVVTNTEINNWSYDSATDNIYSTINSATLIGFISPEEYEDFVFEVRVSSNDGDNDTIGICFGFEDTDGKEHTLVAARTPGGSQAHPSLSSGSHKAKLFDIYYNIFDSDRIDLGSTNGGLKWGDGIVNDARVPTTDLGAWSAFPTGCLIKAKREGDIITLETTNLGSNTYVDSAKVIVDLNSHPALAKFKGPTRIGYICYSQPRATWKTLQAPWIGTASYMTPLRVAQMLGIYKSTILSEKMVPINTNSNGSIRVLYNPTRVEVYAAGSWRQMWPALWT
mgnify:CR=1 FL=1